MSRIYTLTETTLKDWFVEFNDNYFDGELSMPKFKIVTAKTYLGLFCSSTAKSITKPTIKMSVYLDRTEREFRNTFLHEMVHLWQYKNGYNDVHGESFKRKARELNQFGWDIHRCSNTHGATKAYGVKTITRKVDKRVYLFRWKSELGFWRWCMVKPCGLSNCIAEANASPNEYRELEIYSINKIEGFTANTKDLRYYDYFTYQNVVSKYLTKANECTANVMFCCR